MGNVGKFDSEDDEIIHVTPVKTVTLQTVLIEVPGYGKVGMLFFPGERRLVCNNQEINFTDEEWEVFRPHLERLCK